jgi:hypothetical protein
MIGRGVSNMVATNVILAVVAGLSVVVALTYKTIIGRSIMTRLARVWRSVGK